MPCRALARGCRSVPCGALAPGLPRGHRAPAGLSLRSLLLACARARLSLATLPTYQKKCPRGAFFDDLKRSNRKEKAKFRKSNKCSLFVLFSELISESINHGYRFTGVIKQALNLLNVAITLKGINSIDFSGAMWRHMGAQS